MYLEDLDTDGYPTTGIYPMRSGPFNVLFGPQGEIQVNYGSERQAYHSMVASDLRKPGKILDYLRSKIPTVIDSIPYLEDIGKREREMKPYYRVRGCQYLVSLQPFYVTDRTGRELSAWTLRCVEKMAQGGTVIKAIQEILVRGIN